MMEEVDILDNIQKVIVDNDEPNAEGILPDWADKTSSTENSKL